LSLLLTMQSGDRITVADTLFTVLSAPPRLVSTETAIALSEADTVLPHGVTVSLAATLPDNGLTLRFTAPAEITITRTRGSATL